MWIRDLHCKEKNWFCWVTGDRLKTPSNHTQTEGSQATHMSLLFLPDVCRSLQPLCPCDLVVEVFSLGFRGMLVEANAQEDQRIVLSCLGFLADPNLYLLSTICKYRRLTEFRQPLQVQSHLEMPRILVQLGHIQRT